MGVEVKLYAFLNLALAGVEWQAVLHTGHLAPEGVSHLPTVKEVSGTRPSMHVAAKSKKFPDHGKN
jgi:hypothetical protein